MWRALLWSSASGALTPIDSRLFSKHFADGFGGRFPSESAKAARLRDLACKQQGEQS
jgi:hypothetical protein